MASVAQNIDSVLIECEKFRCIFEIERRSDGL